jgi:phosphoglucosamine mutase
LAACRLVALVAREGPLSGLAAGVASYPIRRENVETDRKAAVVDGVAELVADRYPASAVDRLDGVRVETDAGWFLVRASGTQPLVRLTAEARDADEADALLATATGLVERAQATATERDAS